MVRLPSGIQIGLAHTRLSILDLSVAGRQPMSDEEFGSLIVYNGEVYNHMTIRESLNNDRSPHAPTPKQYSKVGASAVLRFCGICVGCLR